MAEGDIERRIDALLDDVLPDGAGPCTLAEYESDGSLVADAPSAEHEPCARSAAVRRGVLWNCGRVLRTGASPVRTARGQR